MASNLTEMLPSDAKAYLDRIVPENIAQMQSRIRELAKQQNAVILAHNYQVPEVQDVADFVGDSLGLAREGAKTSSQKIIFCGVHFMAETAKILNPEKQVLIPDLEAGCSLAASINAEELRAWKQQYPQAIVVTYVNTTAEVKALSDYCCTSGNAIAIIKAIPADKEILFAPDMFLGTYLERVTGRSMRIWPGECHVHAGIRPSDIEKARQEHGDADILIHPECGCATSCMYYAAAGDLPANRVHILSTEGMIKHVQKSEQKNFVVATEIGLLHRLNKEVSDPEKRFYAASEHAVCRYMKKITLAKVLASLETGKFEVNVAPEIASGARQALEKMVSIG